MARTFHNEFIAGEALLHLWLSENDLAKMSLNTEFSLASSYFFLAKTPQRTRLVMYSCPSAETCKSLQIHCNIPVATLTQVKDVEYGVVMRTIYCMINQAHKSGTDGQMNMEYNSKE